MFRPVRSSSGVLKLQIMYEETAVLPYRGFWSVLCGPLYAHVYSRWQVLPVMHNITGRTIFISFKVNKF
jgi:hypothetical protein